jgi:cell division protein FtsN
VLQAGAYATRDQAEAARASLGGLLPDREVRIGSARVRDKAVYRLLVLGFADAGQAQAACTKLERAGKTCFIRPPEKVSLR